GLPFPTVNSALAGVDSTLTPTDTETTESALPTGLPFPTLPPPATPTPTATTQEMEIDLPVLATMDDGAPDWGHTQNWMLASHDNGQAWYLNTTSTTETLLWQQQIDLRNATPDVVLTFDSWFGGGGIAMVVVSSDGTNWQSVATVPTSATWATVTT